MRTNKKDSNFLLKEAELIINNYIRESKKQEVFNNESNQKKAAEVKKKSINMVINAILICSIALLIFVISKII